MTLKDIGQLKAGDKVYWDDPDGGLCSRIYTIKSISVSGDGPDAVITIVDEDDSVLECYRFELLDPNKLKTYKVKVYWQMCAEVTVQGFNKRHAAQLGTEAPLPPSGEWQYVPDSANVDKDVDVHEMP